METQNLSIASARSIVDANFVHRTSVNWADGSEFSPSMHFLYYQAEGIRSMEDWEESYEMAPGDVILFYGGRRYTSWRPPHGYRAMNILFQPVAEDRCEPGRLQSPAPPPDRCLAIQSRIPTHGDPGIRERFADIVQLTHSSMALRRRRAATLLEDLLIELTLRSSPLPQRWNAPVEYAVSFINRNLDRKIEIDELAGLVHLSRRSLTRRFREATGRSIAAYHLEKRVALACSLFKTHPDISLQEVADTLGFYDAFHFSRTFRQHVGRTPTDYRRGIPAVTPAKGSQSPRA